MPLPSHPSRTPSPVPASSSSLPPPLPPRISSSPGPASSSASSSSIPPLPPRPSQSSISVNVDYGSGSDSYSDLDSDDDSATEGAPTPSLGPGASTTSLGLSAKDEEGLSEVQLRELYDDEEIDRFLHLFSTVSRLAFRPGTSVQRFSHGHVTGSMCGKCVWPSPSHLLGVPASPRQLRPVRLRSPSLRPQVRRADCVLWVSRGGMARARSPR